MAGEFKNYSPLILFFIYHFAFNLAAQSFASIRFQDKTRHLGFDLAYPIESAVTVDYDHDGWPDLFLNGKHNQPCALFKNIDGEQFQEIEIIPNQKISGNFGGSLWADFDNDGETDFYLVNLGSEQLFKKTAAGAFINRGSLCQNRISGLVNRAKIFDADCDGWLDIIVTQHNFDPLPDEGPLRVLLLQSPNMTFRKIELQQAMDDNAVAVTDLNLDGWLDMIFYNQFRRNISVVNGKPFQTQIEKNLPAVMKIEGIGGGFGYLAAADFNNDGFEDLVLGARDLLLFWNKEGKLRASTSSTGLIKKGMNVLDFVIADFDNDGWQDLVVLWEDGKAQVFRNRKGAGFENQTTVSGLDSSGSYQAITGGDYNRDGRIDLFLFSARESHYFENTGGWRNFAEVRLVGNQSNREGIGAKVELYSGGICQTRYCGLSQTGRNQSPSNLHFGLGKTNRIDSLKIFWPSGNRQDTFNLTSTGELLLREKGGYFFRDISNQLPTDSAGESKSSGAAFLDFNNDGLSDIYVSNTGVNKLYHNLGDKNFSSVGRSAGVNNAGNGFGVCAADFDNDGWEDIFVSNSSNYPNAFYRNTGEGKYKNISHPSEIFELDQTFGVITADFNNNGFLDLYLSNADSNRFYLNRNNFVFREASEQTGTIHIGPNAAVAADYDNDGDMDIYLSCNMGDSPQEAERGYWPNRLLQNDGNAKFTDVGQFAGVDDSLNSKGACFGDYDNDGDLDLYVANDGTPNRLYQNNGDGTFQEVTAHAGVKLPIAAHTPAFIDFNNDGYLDLYVSGASYLPNNKLAAKADQPEKLYLNLRNGTFRDVSAISGIIQPACTPAAVWGDIDRDGDYDLFLANAFYKKVAPPWPANALYENISRRNRWIGFNLIGHQSNRSAIGAKLFLYTDSLLQMREVNGGYGFCSQSSKEIIFGLSGNMFISKVKIVWPSGTVQTVEDLASNQYYLVHEPVHFAFIQMPYQSRNRLLLIFFLTGIGIVFLLALRAAAPHIKMLVARRKQSRKTIEKPPAAERVKTGSGPVNKILDLFSLEIKLLPYKNDYLLQHQINPPKIWRGSTRSSVSQWGKKHPYPIRHEKMERLNEKLQQLFTFYEQYVLHGRKTDPTPLFLLKELGHRIYYYFGLAGFFQQLFALSEDPPKSFIMNWILEDFDIPWQWTYSKESDLFLCDQFPYSLNLSGWEKLLAEGRIHRQTAGLPSQAPAALLLCQQEAEPENLKHSNHEIDQIQKILTDRQIESVISSPSPDDLTKNILKLKEENKRLRIIHYAGHIQQEILNVRSDDYLAPGFLQEACGLTLDSAPLVFLNGCHTGSGGKTEPQPQRLALEFLDCGAAACVVTQFKITDLSAEKFAGYFYQHFIEQGFDAASSLHHARRDLKKYIEKYSEPDFDISAYFYNLLGRPEIIF